MESQIDPVIETETSLDKTYHPPEAIQGTPVNEDDRLLENSTINETLPIARSSDRNTLERSSIITRIRDILSALVESLLSGLPVFVQSLFKKIASWWKRSTARPGK